MFKNIKYVGYAFIIVSFYYVIQTIVSLDIELNLLKNILTPKNLLYFIISLFLYVFVLYMGAYLWIYILTRLSGNFHLPKNFFIKIYSTANLGKYLPGNVMHYIARNVLANKFSLSHKIIALSSIIEIVFVLLSGTMLLIMIKFLFSINLYFDKYQFFFDLNILFIIFSIFAVVLISIYIFRKSLIKSFCNYKLLIPDPSSLFLFILIGYIIIYLILGINQLIIMIIFDNIEFTQYHYWNILFAFIFSWIIGYVVPGSPGGIGVREAIFILILSQKYSQEAVVLVAITTRLINICGDLLFNFINFIINKHNNIS